MDIFPDLASSGCVIPKLLITTSSDDAEKLLIWKARVRPFLESYDLWDYVSGTLTLPNPESHDGIIKDWLLSTISDDLIPLKNELQLLPTSKEIWDRLDEAMSTVHTTEDEADHEVKAEPLLGIKRTNSSQYKPVTDDGLILSNDQGSHIISARKLEIYMLQEYWDWFSVPGLRFPEVVRLVEGPQNHIRITGKVGGVLDILTPDTSYIVNLVYKLTTGSLIHSQAPFLLASIREDPFDRDECKNTFVSLRHPPNETEEEAIQELDVETPRVRYDGWLEVTLGHFTATTMHVQAGGDYVEVNLSGHEKFGEVPYEDIIIQGMEFKPIATTT